LPDQPGKVPSSGIQLPVFAGKANPGRGIDIERAFLGQQLLREWNNGRLFCIGGIENNKAQQKNECVKFYLQTKNLLFSF
jgi:hypothetical protein